jgi:hypothetical protein
VVRVVVHLLLWLLDSLLLHLEQIQDDRYDNLLVYVELLGSDQDMVETLDTEYFQWHQVLTVQELSQKQFAMQDCYMKS